MSGPQAVIDNIAECLRRCGMMAKLVFIGRILFADRSDPDRTATRRVAADTGCPHTARQSRKKVPELPKSALSVQAARLCVLENPVAALPSNAEEVQRQDDPAWQASSASFVQPLAVDRAL